MDTNTSLSLGRFREEISGLNPPYFERDEPLEPLSVKMQADSINVILGAASYISLRSGNASITLSHIQAIKPSVKHGQKSYRVICGDYTASNNPQPIEYRHIFESPEKIV